ncbi:MAG: hypothetical protein IJG59_04955 [Erysipelotrichaceae bacterium]|nr:hypothetical protein [Erysipelotrichaceae bacterium]
MLKIYHGEIPAFIKEAAKSPEMQRLKKVGMDCGCEYTALSTWENVTPYKRYEHSVGVALIVWHFTGSKKQALAGLFHDISSPAFAHVVDFMNNDHLNQESTEAGTKEIIENSAEIQKLLKSLELTVEDVCDYHEYPIADNDPPKLSADRLEYTLCNLVRYQGYSRDDVKKMYDDLMVGINEYGEEELMFQDPVIAREFVLGCLKNSRLYVCDEDRYSMEVLARILRKAIINKAIDYEDLYKDEEYIIKRIKNSQDWYWFTRLNRVERNTHYNGACWIQIRAKKRYIDPYVYGKGRLSQLDPPVKEELQKFIDLDFDSYLKGFIK